MPGRATTDAVFIFRQLSSSVIGKVMNKKEGLVLPFCTFRENFWPSSKVCYLAGLRELSVEGWLVNPLMPIPQNGQTHPNNSLAVCRWIVWVCLTILWDWRLKGEGCYERHWSTRWHMFYQIVVLKNFAKFKKTPVLESFLIKFQIWWKRSRWKTTLMEKIEMENYSDGKDREKIRLF